MAKYVISASVAPLILTGMIIALSPAPWQRAVIAAMVLAILPLRNDEFRRVLIDQAPAVDRHEDWRGAIAELNAAIRQRPKPVLLNSGFIESAALTDDGVGQEELMEFCVIPGRFPYRIETPTGELHPMLYLPPGKLLPSQAKLVAQHGAYFIINRRASAKVMREVERSLRENGYTGKVKWNTPSDRGVVWMELSVE
jgi:hypothetical protein